MWKKQRYDGTGQQHNVIPKMHKLILLRGTNNKRNRNRGLQFPNPACILAPDALLSDGAAAAVHGFVWFRDTDCDLR